MRAGEWWRRLVFLLRRDRRLAELEDEMRLHVELRAQRMELEGTPAEQARKEARHRFGDALRVVERSRDEWGGLQLEAWLQDVRLAARGLRRSPFFTLV